MQREIFFLNSHAHRALKHSLTHRPLTFGDGVRVGRVQDRDLQDGDVLAEHCGLALAPVGVVAGETTPAKGQL